MASLSTGFNSVAVSWSGVPGSTYTVQRSTNLVTDAFSTLDSDIPGLEEANTSTVAIPDESAIYRVIVE